MLYIKYNNTMAKKTNYDGYYATENGEILTVKVKGGQGSLDYSKPRLHCLKVDKDGYLEACLSIVENNRHYRKYKRVHRLVWETFNGAIPSDLTIDHINGNKQDNHLCNLRLLSREKNTSLAVKGKKSPKRYKYKLYLYDVFIGIFDRQELSNIFGLKYKDWYVQNKRFDMLHQNGYRWEKIKSVEDIERIA